MKTIDELAGRDISLLRDTFADSLIGAGWDLLLGKERGGVQSLLDHSLSAFDVLVACLPFFAEECHPPLEREEVVAVLLASIAHDAGKASADFQAYLRREGTSFAEHVDEDAIRTTADRVAQAASVDLGDRLEDVVSAAILHDRRLRRAAGEMHEWERGHVSPRWRKLADLVDHADSLASKGDVVAAERFLASHPTLLAGASTAFYQVRLRGALTTYLHEAVLREFERRGWTPIVYFAEGTLFAGRGVDRPSRADIGSALAERLGQLLAQRDNATLAELAVGDITGNFLPRPEYVRQDGITELLGVAARRIGRKELKDKEVQRLKEKWAKVRGSEDPADAPVDALQSVGPEVALFKIAKYIFEAVLSNVGGNRERYERMFGEGTFGRLMSQSTFMRVEDYRACVQPWHAHRAAQRPTPTTIGDMAPERRERLLRRSLLRVFRRLLSGTEALIPYDRLPQEWAAACLGDLTMEEVPSVTDVEAELKGYEALKARAPSNSLQCCQCAAMIVRGEGDVPSDALGNKGTFSNRRLAFAAPGEPPICRRCATDIKIGQLALGRPRAELVIAAIPRRALGPSAAHEFLERVRSLRSTLDRQLSPSTMDLSAEIPLWAPGRLIAADESDIGGVWLQPLNDKGRKQRRGALKTALSEVLGPTGLQSLNKEFATAFGDLTALADGLLDGTAPGAVRGDSDIARALRAIGPAVGFGSVTPNLIVVSFDRLLGTSKTSDADHALYAFGLAALFATRLNAAVAVCPPAEVRTAIASRAARAVYVPANGPVRRLLGGDWIPMDPGSKTPDARRWLRAIQAAVRLQNLMSGAGRKPPSLLEILRFPSVGYAIRQVESRRSSPPFWAEEWSHVEALKEVLG